MAEVAGAAKEALEAAANQAARDLAYMAAEEWRRLAYERLKDTATQYADGIAVEDLGNAVYRVSLDKDLKYLESGYSSFDMKPGLLKNAKKFSKRGYPYRAIPFTHKTTGDFGQDLKRLRGAFGDRGNTLSPSGSPMVGKAWSLRRDPMGAWKLTPGRGSGEQAQRAFLTDPQPTRHLDGLQKTQWKQPLRKGGFRVRSEFTTFRTVSGDPRYAMKWLHPGFRGAGLLPEVQRWALANAYRVLDELLGR